MVPQSSIQFRCLRLYEVAPSLEVSSVLSFTLSITISTSASEKSSYRKIKTTRVVNNANIIRVLICTSNYQLSFFKYEQNDSDGIHADKFKLIFTGYPYLFQVKLPLF